VLQPHSGALPLHLLTGFTSRRMEDLAIRPGFLAFFSALMSSSSSSSSSAAAGSAFFAGWCGGRNSACRLCVSSQVKASYPNQDCLHDRKFSYLPL
uniref:Uncharacterized protein n=1 Tax=Pavo cristatus TaxID=9049 RepID=A0A8C9FJN5_PAVCR